jgi:riboflavin synthase
MFTGLIREKAKVVSFIKNTLLLKATYRPNIGDSVAVNGVCLTVIKVGDKSFKVEVSPETKSVVAIENFKDEVHIEPAMRMSDRVEGHILQGHIDTIGKIIKIQKSENSYDFYIEIDKKFMRFVIPKGSIAVDGVSLTVNEVFDDSFRLTIIPHTVENTLFQKYKVGTRVNIETDMFARYIYHIFKGNRSELNWSDIDKIMAIY